MRQDYYDLISFNYLPDVLSSISDITYSYKYKVISTLLEKYDSDIVSKALNIYKQDYIISNRVYMSNIQVTLTKICGFLHKKEKEKEKCL